MAEVFLEDLSKHLHELLAVRRDREAGFALGRHILRYWPRHLDTYAQLGQAALSVGLYADAADLLRRALSADPEAGDLWAGLRQALAAQGQVEESDFVAVYEHDLLPDPVDPEQSPLAQATLAVKQDAWGEALAHYRQALAETPQDVVAALGLAGVLARLGRFAQCEQAARAVSAQLPYCLRAHLLLAECSRQTGRSGAAGHELAARDLDPDGLYAWRRFNPSGPEPSPRASLAAWNENERWAFAR